MAGYPGTPLPKKLGIKAGHKVCLLNAPGSFERHLEQNDVRTKFPGGTDRVFRAVFDAHLVFAQLFEVEFEKAGETDLIINQ